MRALFLACLLLLANAGDPPAIPAEIRTMLDAATGSDNERAYLYGAAQFESDRFQGFDQRYAVSAGGGYSALRRPGLELDLEVGPAYRNTRFVDANGESNPALRGSLDLDWRVNRSATVRQNASAYVQSANSTIASKSALVTRLVGPLSAQLSYALQ